MRYVFFVNPTAGKGKKQDGIISAINDYFSKNGGNFKIVVTEYKSQAESLAREEAETGDELRIFA
ncbi:MAG: diacylglycerol kinase family lipid kinase, partial [Clostridia bacterium]|nr:diacylglycerol kinase family lipid kinase [Clostridia bacterium]